MIQGRLSHDDRQHIAREACYRDGYPGKMSRQCPDGLTYVLD